MNRMEEYNTLLKELAETPEGFGSAAQNARARLLRRRRRQKIFLLPCGSLAACFLLFMVLVNTSASFAYACSSLPLLGKLAQAVSFSPSLKAALENDYIQEMNLSQSKPGVTMSIDYLIVDQKQVNIFYTLYSSKYENIDIRPDILRADGSQLNGFAVSIPGTQENGELHQITIDFMDQDVPDQLRLDCVLTNSDTLPGPDSPIPAPEASAHVSDAAASEADSPAHAPGRTIAEFSFLLEFDPQFTASGITLSLKENIILSGNTFCLEQVGIYPTHMNLFFTESADNSAWLTGLGYYVENENGERFDKIKNGITATGGTNSSSMLSQRLESAFFSSSEKLTLVITGADLLEKDMEYLEIDLKKGTARGPLPQGVTFLGAEPSGGGYKLDFQCVRKTGTPMFSPFTLSDEDSGSWSATSENLPGAEPKQEGWETFTTSYYVNKSAGPVIYLKPGFTTSGDLDEPIRITLKQ